MTQNEVLANLINDNQLTDYGRKHHFDLIKTWDDYNKYVPLTSYADYESFIDEMRQGKKDVLTAYPLACMLTTSGSSGNPKNIPLTGRALQQYSSLIFSNLLDKAPEGKILHTSVFRYPLERKLCGNNSCGTSIKDCDCKTLKDDSLSCDSKNIISNLNVSDNSSGENSHDCASDSHPESYNTLLSAVYFAYLVQTGAMDLSRFVGGEKLNFSFEIADVMFVKAWSALYEKNLVEIQSIFMYDGLMLFSYIENSGLDIVRYMKERRIPDEIQVSQEIKDYLIENMIPDDERISELEDILSGPYEGIARRLWPDLQLISGISGMFFDSREKLLSKYTGDVPLHYFAFVSSECMAGVALDGPSARYKLISDNGYYEFLDLTNRKSDRDERNHADDISRYIGENHKGISEQESCDKRDKCDDDRRHEDSFDHGVYHVYNCSNVPTGRKLELVITNWSGLYRYRTGDIVVVDEFIDGMPVIHFVNRRKLAINIAGEKTSEEMLDQAIYKLRMEDDLKIFECSVWMDYDNLPGRYVVLLELDQNEKCGSLSSIVDSNEKDSFEAGKSEDSADCNGNELKKAEGQVESNNLNYTHDAFTSKLASDFDVIMKSVNPDYEDLRNLQAISCPSVRIIPKGYHAVHRGQSSQAKPGLIGQQGDMHSFI